MPFLPTQDILTLSIIFFATVTQAVSGFGSALVAMALLTPLIGIQNASPLVALFTLAIEIILLAYFRDAIKMRNIWPVIVASLIGTPIGVFFLKQVPADITMTLLGLFIAGYAVYALLKFRLPRLEHPLWAYLTGFVAGVVGGAYNTSGPPVIVYGDCRGWEPAEFKANLQGFFLFSSLVVAITHFAGGNLTGEVWRWFGMSLPVSLAAVWVGLRLDSRLNPKTFRTIVLVLLIFLGLRLMF